MRDLLVARDLIELGTVMLRWVPTRHMLADSLTKAMKPTDIYDKFRDQQIFLLVQTGDDKDREQHRFTLRQG